MLFARLEFHPDHARHFLDSRSQTTSEVPFEDEDDLVECVDKIKDYLTGCTVLNAQVGRPRYHNLLNSNNSFRPLPKKTVKKIASYLDGIYSMSCVETTPE